MLTYTKRHARHARLSQAEQLERLRREVAKAEGAFLEELVADFRKLTKRRKQTPSEVLLREGRDER